MTMALKLLKRSASRLFGMGPPVVSVLKLAGTIAASSRLRGGLSLEALNAAIERAFEGKSVKAVALAINSPGGAPAQSMLIHDRIRTLAAEKKLPVFAFAEDVAASGGYMLACAGDEIYATESSILGSIGVIAATFGFERLIARAGIERRLYTAGSRKSLLDPFLPADNDQIERLMAVQHDIHDSFKALVRTRRGSRLRGAEEELFSGEFWTGRQAVRLGLADGIADLRGEMRRRFGPDVVFRMVSPERRWRLFGGSAAATSSVVPSRGPLATSALLDDMLARIEARAIWARFGL
jgi:signal peptide peptidase SppA